MVSTRLFTLLILCFVSSIFLSVSESKVLEPHAAESFNVSLIQVRPLSSPPLSASTSPDIYAPRLDDPSIKTFEQCSSDTFEINGPCTYEICYVYLYRSGPDGWIPESVKIHSHGSKSAVTFPYNTLVPESVWYGFNYCKSASGSSSVLDIGLGRIVLAFKVLKSPDLRCKAMRCWVGSVTLIFRSPVS
ncbi:hypothetical protein Bca4012_067650 [Brassica carinata]